MIGKALNKSQKKIILILSVLGAMIGLGSLLSAFQSYLDLKHALTDESQYLVIKKQISTLNTVGLFSSNFSESELDELQNQPFVNDLAPFKSGKNFEVMAMMSFEGGKFPAFSTLAFFESIPDQFIDVSTENWKWEEGSEEVPVIMPNTFLDAYNYGIAPSMGGPQASKNLLSSFRFKLRVRGNGKEAIYYGKVMNFSDRVNSILVPDTFLDFLNTNYGTGETPPSTRVILAVDNPKDPTIKSYLEDKGYDTNQEQLKGSILEKAMGFALKGMLFFGVVIIALCIIIYILYGEVIIGKSSYEIGLLLLLGYTMSQISKEFLKLFAKIYATILIGSLVIVYSVKLFVDQSVFKALNYESTGFISPVVMASGLAFTGLFLLINYLSAKRSIKEIARPK